jgi:RNA polymerase sigma-70 factor (ECF subfamily)
MERASPDLRLSQISTMWTMLLRAHTPTESGATVAQHALLERYGGAVYRYLLGAVRNPDVAAELTQEFAVRFLRGDFRRADPGRGRFRDYLRKALIHLVTDHYRAEAGSPQPLGTDPPAPPLDDPDSEAIFVAGWRAELLDKTWDALAADHPTGHAALLLRVEQPELSSSQMAERLTERFGKPFTADAVRKALQRAHAQFSDLLLEEVARTLNDPAPADLENELRALDLLRYCRSALERRGSGSSCDS